MLLGDEHLRVQAIPAPRPVLVRPAQAEGKVEVGIGQQLIQRAPEQSLAAEPIVVIAESMEPVRLGQFDLTTLHFNQAKVVEAQLAWQVGLIVSRKPRSPTGNVVPLGESLAPPPIVLGNRVKLRQVERDRLDSGVDGLRSHLRDIFDDIAAEASQRSYRKGHRDLPNSGEIRLGVPSRLRQWGDRG